MAFKISTLSNGLNILTYNMSNLETIAINLVVGVGSRYEETGEAGISHFLEHMAFKGTNNRSAKIIAEQFDSIGGHFNAYTSRERTVYYAKILKNNFPLALEIIADIILNSKFQDVDIEKEYQVILQEIAGVYDDPDELAYEKLYEVAYPNQKLGNSILGTKDSLKNFNKTSFQNYLAKHYSSNNMCLSMAGNIDHDQAVLLSERLFSDLKSKPINVYDKANYVGGCSLIKKDLEQTTLVYSFAANSYMNIKEFYHDQMLSLILGGGISSRLFQQIRENLGLAYGVGSHVNGYADTGLFNIYASTGNDNVELLINNLVEEIKKVKDNIDRNELERVKMQIKASIYMAEEKSSYKSENIGKNYAIFKKYFDSNEIIKIVEEAKIEDISVAATRIFSTNPTLSIIGPKADLVNYEILREKIKNI